VWPSSSSMTYGNDSHSDPPHPDRQAGRVPKFHWHAEALDIRHIYIRARTPRLNGKVERSHRVDDQEFYQLLDRDGIFDDIHLFNQKLREWEDYYNYHRPHGHSVIKPHTNGFSQILELVCHKGPETLQPARGRGNGALGREGAGGHQGADQGVAAPGAAGSDARGAASDQEQIQQQQRQQRRQRQEICKSRMRSWTSATSS
jgi:hypothetical protein